jgi:hypothetical protein
VCLVAGGDDDGEAERGGVGSAPTHRARSGRDEWGTRSYVVDGEAQDRAEFGLRVRGFAHSFVL